MAILTTQPGGRAVPNCASPPTDDCRLDGLRAVETLTAVEPGTREGLPARELARLLFGCGSDREESHGMWRRLISNQTFRHRPGRSPADQAAQAYTWLRLVNDTIEDAERLARDPILLASLHEWAAIVDGGGSLCTVASIHYNLFLGSLLDHDPDERRDLSDFTSMRRIGTFLCTELDHGNDSFSLETTAELDRETGGFILHTPHPGAQKFMPNSSTTGGPKTAMVAARLMIDGQDEGVFLFLTPLSDESGLLPGVQVRRLPFRAGAPVDHCLTAFHHVRLPREALFEADHGRLGHDGTLTSSFGNRRKRFLHSIGRVTVGKLCMSGAAVGASRAALNIAVRYGQHRRVAGPKAGQRIPINAHRTHHSRLLNSLATAYAMTFLHRSVLSGWVHHTAENRNEAERLVAVAKGWITWQARTIAAECRERCGAQGLLAVNGLSEYAQYIEGTVTAEGDNLVIWAKAAGELLLGHWATATPVPPSAGPGKLADPYFLRTLLFRAQAIWQARARTALRRERSDGSVARWNKASSAALEMVSVHAALRAADAFIEAMEQAGNPQARRLLEQLCTLFLLDQISTHTGDLLAEAHINADHIRELPLLTDSLLDDLAPHMSTLVEAFDLPDQFLAGIPIANSAGVDLADYALAAE
ncbi:acyl-CoA oxidase [Streptomyces decoyicus]|uniref:Acyl-CoA oxidase n=1 Tax=Streptomyces decoyicus TaxID=249567 RepID=A0ABZ1FHV7_9ACTN|nr:acyl-CoA dehydrogenase [Streptomyces decoyicus]WSB69293.1 acyl-CoA oxidase [Streptomyces decoyicus]